METLLDLSIIERIMGIGLFNIVVIVRIVSFFSPEETKKQILRRIKKDLLILNGVILLAYLLAYLFYS